MISDHACCDEGCDDRDSTTTIFSTSSQGSALSILSMSSVELANMTHETESNPEDRRKEALVLVNDLLEQRQKAIHLLEDISMRPTPEPYVVPQAEPQVQEEESEHPAETEEPRPENPAQISSKEFFRRIRQRLSKKEFKTFVANMKELNALREERVRRKYVSIIHPFPFSCWPKILINVGEWESVPTTA